MDRRSNTANETMGVSQDESLRENLLDLVHVASDFGCDLHSLEIVDHF